MNICKIRNPQSLKTFIDRDGRLTPVEFYDVPFKPKRMFYVTNVPKNDIRGGHAHYETQQLLICIDGRIGVMLFDGYNEHYTVIEKDEAVFVDKMIWDSQIFLTGNDVMVSLCSTNYDKNDYIENKEQFIKLVKDKSYE
ncbi:MAG: putative TDP-4-oxo-6-deoxy-alpha-D-glucose-3,4-oxoisomerase [Promethearchaeota archaeon]|nr:MAG: putative TDP-4-oxo-6-deoxy-alpha-D-glucose-3,4-oxoisomerase [Candidatus Lokiarchaeota archaeon]